MRKISPLPPPPGFDPRTEMNRVITSTWTDTASVIVTLKVSGDLRLIGVGIPGRERRLLER